jgi:hypothetical protein
MAYILALTGDIGSGKSEFTRMVHEIEPDSESYESREIITEAANKFNEFLRRYDTGTINAETVNEALVKISQWMNDHFKTGIDPGNIVFTDEEAQTRPELFTRLHDYLDQIKADPAMLGKVINAENKPQFRAILQWLGGYFPYKYRPGIWFEEIGRRIIQLDPQPKVISVNALRYPHDEITIRRFAAEHNYDCSILEIVRPSIASNSGDVTERSRKQIESDTKIINNGSLEDLKDVAEELLKDLPSPQTEYTADKLLPQT